MQHISGQPIVRTRPKTPPPRKLLLNQMRQHLFVLHFKNGRNDTVIKNKCMTRLHLFEREQKGDKHSILFLNHCQMRQHSFFPFQKW